MSKEDAPPPYTDATNGLFQASTKPSFCSNCGSKLASTLCSACGLYAATAPAPETIQTQPGIGFSPSTVTPMTHQPQHEFTGGPSTSGLEFYKIFNDRLIIDFEKVSCLPCQTVGIFDQNLRSCPDPLKQKGITDAKWQKWMEDLMEVQKKAPSVLGCLTIFCFPGFIPQSLLCVLCCPTSSSHALDCLPCFYGDWYRGLIKWMDTVNMELNKLEMHAKLLTYKPHQRAPKSMFHGQRVTGKDEKYEMSFLAIGLNKAASEKLISESWDHGVNDGCLSGHGRIL